MIASRSADCYGILRTSSIALRFWCPFLYTSASRPGTDSQTDNRGKIYTCRRKPAACKFYVGCCNTFHYSLRREHRVTSKIWSWLHFLHSITVLTSTNLFKTFSALHFQKFISFILCKLFFNFFFKKFLNYFFLDNAFPLTKYIKIFSVAYYQNYFPCTIAIADPYATATWLHHSSVQPPMTKKSWFFLQ